MSPVDLDLIPPVDLHYDCRSQIYFRRALVAPRDVVKAAKKTLKGVDFDTIAVRGVSGLLMGSILSYVMDKHLFIVRKQMEVGSGDWHSRRNEGAIGHRWLFVDDLVCSGRTREHVRAAVRECAPDSTQVGSYLYEHDYFVDH